MSNSAALSSYRDHENDFVQALCAQASSDVQATLNARSVDALARAHLGMERVFVRRFDTVTAADAWTRQRTRALGIGRSVIHTCGTFVHAIVIDRGAELALVRANVLTYILDPGVREPRLYVVEEGLLRASEIQIEPAAEGQVTIPATTIIAQLTAQTARGRVPVATLVLRSVPLEPSASTWEAFIDSVRRIGTESRALRVNRLMSQMAQARAETVCNEDALHHVTRAGTPQDFMRRGGLESAFVGEVLAVGRDVQDAQQHIFASPSHRYVMQQQRFTDVGLGVYTSADGSNVCVALLFAQRPRFVVR